MAGSRRKANLANYLNSNRDNQKIENEDNSVYIGLYNQLDPNDIEAPNEEIGLGKRHCLIYYQRPYYYI